VRKSIETILEWDFDRVVMSHGDILATGGKEQFRQAYEFLLSGNRATG
jgi:hypothetical protein